MNSARRRARVGVPDFIDEWVSAPYEAQQKDGKVIRAGLAWIDDEAKKRFPERLRGLRGCGPDGDPPTTL